MVGASAGRADYGDSVSELAAAQQLLANHHGIQPEDVETACRGWWRTHEDLEGNYPTGTVVLDSGKYAWQLSYPQGWQLSGGTKTVQYGELLRDFGPLTVVYVPEERDT